MVSEWELYCRVPEGESFVERSLMEETARLLGKWGPAARRFPCCKCCRARELQRRMVTKV